MTFQHFTTVHDPAFDQPVKRCYDGISRLSSGARFELQQGESGKFYGRELELAIDSLARWGKDHYDYNTFTTPIQVTLYPQPE